MEDEKGMPEMEVTGLAISFAELDKERNAMRQVHDMAEMTEDYNMLVKNIMGNPFVEDKAAAMKALTEEFAQRLDEGEMEEGDKAVWNTAYINDLPDSAFLYIAPGGEKDGEGKTTPRDLRKFPYKDSDGKIDLPHLRNAIARIPQSNAPGLTSEKKQQLQDKARKILEKQGNGEKSFLETIKGWFDEVKDLLSKKPQVELDLDYSGKAFKTFKGTDGKTWIVLWTTNAFIDREKEIFTTKSVDDFVERHKADDVKGEFWFWHLPKSKFGDIKLQSRVGRFLVEAGPFDDTAIGRRFKEFFESYPDSHPTIAPEGWGASHGYSYNPNDREDSVYEWFEKHESSVLPVSVASNPHNPGMSLKEVNELMDSQEREAWNKTFGKEFVDEILQTGETKTAELEQAGVEYKGDQVEEAEEEAVMESVEEAEAPVETKEEPATEEVEKTEEVKEEAVEEQEDSEQEEAVEEKEVSEPPITRQELADALKMVVDELTQRFETKITEEINTTVDAMVEVVTPIANQVKALSQTEEQKIARHAENVPTASLTSMIKGSLFGEETHIDGRTALAKDGPEETKDTSDGKPSIAGRKLDLW